MVYWEQVKFQKESEVAVYDFFKGLLEERVGGIREEREALSKEAAGGEGVCYPAENL